MSKVGKMGKMMGKAAKAAKKGPKKEEFGNTIKTYMRAGKAAPGPPLGPSLGARGIPIGQFCKDFNEKTKHIKDSTLIPCRIIINPDRSWTIEMNHPPSSYFLKQAAGITAGGHKQCNYPYGIVTLKHIYEIAKLKKEDKNLQELELKEICKQIIASSRSVGIKVVKDIELEELRTFREEAAERRRIEEEAMALARQEALEALKA